MTFAPAIVHVSAGGKTVEVLVYVSKGDRYAAAIAGSLTLWLTFAKDKWGEE